MRKKDVRHPKSRYHDAPGDVALDAQNRQPTAIVGSRFFGGSYQYEVQWEGDEETYWENADSLTCIDLIEQYEINKE